MSIDVAELGSTFVLGAVALLALDAILVGLLGVKGIGFFAGEWGYERRTETALFIGAALVIGLIAEDYSYRMVDSENTPFVGPYRFARVHVAPPLFALFNYAPDSVLVRRRALRFRALVSDDGGEDGERVSQCRIEPLGRELGCRHALERSDVVLVRPDGARVLAAPYDAWLCSGSDGPWQALSGAKGNEELREMVERLFYHAKNRVYQVQTLNGELRRIESRSSFARSLGLVAFGFLLLVLPLGASTCVGWVVESPAWRLWLQVGFMGLFVSGVALARHFAAQTDFAAGVVCGWLLLQCIVSCLLLWIRRADCVGNSEEKKRLASARTMTVCLPFLLALLYFGGIYSYIREQEEFNKRVFGYYSESLSQPERPSLPTGAPMPERDDPAREQGHTDESDAKAEH